MKTALQLYSIREGLFDHLAESIDEVKAMGYDGAEIAGWPFEDILRIIAEMNRVGLEVFSIHTNPGDLDTWTEESVARLAETGCRYFPICYLPEERIAGGAEYSRTLEQIASFAALAARYGIRVLYHNHDFDLAPYGTTTKLDTLYADTDSSVLGAELDTCWIYTAGHDPLAYFRKYSDRCPILHLKDCVKEGGHKGFCAVGHGAIDFAPILAAARECGTPWLCVEQDTPTEGMSDMQCARASIESIRSMWAALEQEVAQ